MLKICQSCGREFSTHAGNAKHCPECRDEIRRRRNRECYHRNKERAHEYYLANRERILERRRGYYWNSAPERKTYTFVCEHCGKQFESLAYNAKRCPDCRPSRNVQHRVTKKREPGHVGRQPNVFTCVICGKQFETIAQLAKYCPDCRLDAKREQNRLHKAELAEARRTGQSTECVSTCVRCGEKFTSPRKRKYCPDCHTVVHRERNTAWKRNHREVRPPKPAFIKRQCERCGTTIEVARGSKRRLCAECAHIRLSEVGFRLANFNQKNKTTRICKFCGKEFEGVLRAKTCPECLSNLRKLQAERMRQFYETRQSKPKAGKTLDDWAHEAAQCNLDYGTYRALIAAGKTFDELFAGAGKRANQFHSHVHA